MHIIGSYGSLDRFQELRKEKKATLDDRHRDLVRHWLSIGHENLWIRTATDPPFSELSFHICADQREMVEKLLHGNWCVGQAFVLGDIAMIQQVNGGDEWLTIKGATAFESITAEPYGSPPEQVQNRLHRILTAIQRSTAEQCKAFEYMENAPETNDDTTSLESLRKFSAHDAVKALESYGVSTGEGDEEQATKRILEMEARAGHGYSSSDVESLCDRLSMDIFELYAKADELLTGGTYSRDDPEFHFLQLLLEAKNRELYGDDYRDQQEF